jgi:DNA-binding CsgD family transcriptional regulator
MHDKSVILTRQTRRFSHDQQVAARRERTLVLVSQGRRPSEIAAELGIGESTTRRDLSHIMQMAKEDIKSYTQDRLPYEFQKSLAVLDSIKKEAFAIANKTDINDKDKILALRLAAETEASRVKLLFSSEGPSVVLALNDISEKVNKLEDLSFSQKLQGQFQIAR